MTKGEPIAEIETDKTTIQIESFASGVLRRIVAPAGQKVPVGQVIGIIAEPGEPLDEPTQAAPRPTEPPPAPTAIPVAAPAANTGRVIATPVARRLAEQYGVDLRLVKGSGPEGRITKADVEAYVATAQPALVTPAPSIVSRRLLHPYSSLRSHCPPLNPCLRR